MEKGLEFAIREWVRHQMSGAETAEEKAALFDIERLAQKIGREEEKLKPMYERRRLNALRYVPSAYIQDRYEQERRLRQISKETGRYNGGVGTGLETALPPGYEN